MLVDLRMPGMGGLDLIQGLRAVDSSMKVVMLTGYGSIPTAVSAMKRGADYYLSKPIDVDQILTAYENLQSAATVGVPKLRKASRRWREWSGSTCSACWPIAEITFRRLPACSAFIASRCNESWESILLRANE